MSCKATIASSAVPVTFIAFVTVTVPPVALPIADNTVAATSPPASLIVIAPFNAFPDPSVTVPANAN